MYDVLKTIRGLHISIRSKAGYYTKPGRTWGTTKQERPTHKIEQTINKTTKIDTFMKQRIIFFAFVILMPIKAFCGDIPTPGSLIFGDFIKQATDKLNDLISHAQAAGQILEIEAGGQILTVIDQARYAYHNEMVLTIGELDAAATNTVNSINSVLTAFEEKAYTDARDLEARALVISHNLPFAKHFPQIVTWSPKQLTSNFKSSSSFKVHNPPSRYVKSASTVSAEQAEADFKAVYQKVTEQENKFFDDNVLITFDGDFYDMFRKKYNAVLKINNKNSFTNSTKTSQEIGFLVPRSALIYSDNSISYNTCDITIPYSKTVLLFFHKKMTADFKVYISSLPKNLGTLTVTTHVSTPVMVTVDRSSGQYSQLSSDDDIKCGGEHADLAIHCINATPGGWQIIPGSVGYHMNHAEGEWNYCGPDHSTAGTACVNFNTIHHGFGTSGKIWFNITYKETNQVIQDVITNIPVGITWSQSRVVTIPQSATWSAKFIQFDGKEYDFGGPDTNNPYIKVSTSGQNITFRSIP